MSDLTEFLLARIVEDETVAREIAAEMVRVADQYRPGMAPDPDDMGIHAFEDGRNTPAVIVGPARVMAECEAKRRIVAEHPQFVDADFSYCETCERSTSPCSTLRILALPYADHPDYRPEWRP